MAKATKTKKTQTSALNIVPAAGYLLIEPLEAQTKTDGTGLGGSGRAKRCAGSG